MDHSTEPAAGGQVADKQAVLVVATLASFVGSLMNSSLNIAIPSIGREFATDAITLSWVATATLLALSVALVPVGRIADIFGRRRIFLYGAVAWTITSLLCGLATSAGMLIAFRALQGLAGAMFTATATAIVTSVYPPRERGHALGIAVAGVYVGLAVGPSFGGVMTQHLGWRSMLFLNSALGLVATWLILTRLRAEWAEARGERLDPVGAVVFAVALLAVMYGFSTLPNLVGLVLILVGLLALVAFVIWESRTPDPTLDVSLFRRNAVFAFSNLAALINYIATFAVTFLLSLYLQYVRGLDPQTAGLIILAEPIVMAIFSPLAGRLSDRVEPRLVASAGMALTAAGLAMLALVDDATSIEYIVVALVVAGFGFALFSSPNTNAVMSSVGRAYLGVASATLGVMRSVGQMLSMGIATLLIAIYVGGVQITPQSHESFTTAFRLAFTIFAILCALGVFASLSRGKVRA